jgi:Ras family
MGKNVLIVGLVSITREARSVIKCKWCSYETSAVHRRPFWFEFSDTSSLTNYTLIQLDLVILCYYVSNIEPMAEVQRRRRKEVIVYHRKRREDRIPIMLMGLKRDLRDVRVEKGEEFADPVEVRI